MKTWLTVRLSDDGLVCLAWGSDEEEDSDEVVHTVNASCPVKLPKDVSDGLQHALDDAAEAVKHSLARSTRRHMTVIEDQLESKGVVAKIGSAAKKVFKGGTKASGHRS